MSVAARAVETRPGRAALDGLAAAGLLWPLLAARRPPERAASGSGRLGPALLAVGLDPALPGRVVTARSGACIEGFPRSANSLAVYAFMRLNPRVRLAHHVHAAFQLRRAARLGVPCALIVRPPLDTVSSVILMTGGRVSEAGCYRSYIRYHRQVGHHRGRFVTCEFDDVVADPSIVVRLLNERYGTGFAYEPGSPDVSAWLTYRLGTIVRERLGVAELSAPVPSDAKDRRREELRDRLSRHPLRPAAEAAYATLAAGTARPAPGSEESRPRARG